MLHAFLVGPYFAKDTSFYTVHQRRIPTYDALIDRTCPVLSSPERLRWAKTIGFKPS